MILVFSCSVGNAATAANTGQTDGQPGDTVATTVPIKNSPALALNSFSTLQAIMPSLADKRVVIIGEQHARYDHHLSQLEIIRRLHALDSGLAIGMEMFQQPFQPALDNYVAGDIDVEAMLRATEYYQRWRMDYRLYAPILQYAREHGLPLIALNVPKELTRRVGRVGLEGLGNDERQQLPVDMAPADEAYRQRIEAVFNEHPSHGQQSFEHFLEAQLLWDEGMAERAATYLKANPGHRLVIIAGNQHVAWGSTIPERLQRRLDVPLATILNSWQGAVAPGLADFLLMPAVRSLPPAGKIGALLEDGDQELIITSCLQDSACADVGVKDGDRITTVDKIDINSIADLRLALWDKQPGDRISIAIARKRLLLPDKTLNYELTLK